MQGLTAKNDYHVRFDSILKTGAAGKCGPEYQSAKQVNPGNLHFFPA